MFRTSDSENQEAAGGLALVAEAVVKQQRLWRSSRGCGKAAEAVGKQQIISGYRGALKACSEAQTRGQTEAGGLAVKTVQQLQWRQQIYRLQ